MCFLYRFILMFTDKFLLCFSQYTRTYPGRSKYLNYIQNQRNGMIQDALNIRHSALLPLKKHSVLQLSNFGLSAYSVTEVPFSVMHVLLKVSTQPAVSDLFNSSPG
jgi:hypothetical protein